MPGSGNQHRPADWGCITDVPGVRVGVETDLRALTGLAVVLFDGGAVGAVSVSGPSRTTRNCMPWS
jgi:L-aminopeptidase/D-esterase-like protein